MMEPVYNRLIFNSTVKVQLYGFFSFLKFWFGRAAVQLSGRALCVTLFFVISSKKLVLKTS